MVKCVGCGEMFEPRSGQQMYCTIRCRNTVTKRRARETREKLRAEREAKKAAQRPPKPIKMKPLDQMTEDELLHYGRLQTQAQLCRR